MYIQYNLKLIFTLPFIFLSGIDLEYKLDLSLLFHTYIHAYIYLHIYIYTRVPFHSFYKMFYKKWMKRTVRLHPKSFGRKMSQVLHKTLEMEVRGVSLGKAGYCVCVLQVKPGDGGGKIQEGTGFAIFQLHFEAVMFRPFKNEIMDVKVLNCVHLGFFGYAGPIKVFVSRHQMPQDMQEGYNAMDEAWLSEDKEVEIKENCGVRLKIISCTLENQQWTCVGTIAEEYLGLVDLG